MRIVEGRQLICWVVRFGQCGGPLRVTAQTGKVVLGVFGDGDRCTERDSMDGVETGSTERHSGGPEPTCRRKAPTCQGEGRGFEIPSSALHNRVSIHERRYVLPGELAVLRSHVATGPLAAHSVEADVGVSDGARPRGSAHSEGRAGQDSGEARPTVPRPPTGTGPAVAHGIGLLGTRLNTGSTDPQTQWKLKPGVGSGSDVQALGDALMIDVGEDTHQKALQINLDPRRYGTVAEIGPAMTRDRSFRVGGAAGISKSISAYDMAVSDAIYGEADRYVSADRPAPGHAGP